MEILLGLVIAAGVGYVAWTIYQKKKAPTGTGAGSNGGSESDKDEIIR